MLTKDTKVRLTPLDNPSVVMTFWVVRVGNGIIIIDNRVEGPLHCRVTLSKREWEGVYANGSGILYKVEGVGEER